MILRPLPSRFRHIDIGSTFRDLPNEMLEQIFDNLEPIVRQKLRLVCSIWDNVISSFYPLELKVTDSNWREMMNCKGRVLSPSISHMSQRWEVYLNLPNFDSWCTRLQKVEFSGEICASLMLPFLCKCVSLQELVLNAVKLKKNERAEKNEENVYFPNDWKSFQGKFPMIRTFQFCFSTTADYDYIGLNINEADLNLFQVFTEILSTGVLRKLKIVEDEHPWIRDFTRYMLFVVHGGQVSSTDDKFEKAFKKLMESNKSTLRTVEVIRKNRFHEFGNENLELHLNPQSQPSDKLQVERYAGFVEVRKGWDYPPRLDPWLGCLILQDRLTNLDMEFLELYYGPGEFWNSVQKALSGIVWKHKTSLATVKFILPQPNRPWKDPTQFNLFDVFSKCTSLKSLTVDGKNQDVFDLSRRSWPLASSPTFTGFDQLPTCLKYFRTNFSIQTQTRTLEELDLTNLKGLDTFVSTARPMFVLDDVGSHRMNIKTLNVLRAKLPGLKKMVFKISDFRWSNHVHPVITVTKIGSDTVYFAGRKFINRFHDSIYDEHEGAYLKLEY